VADRYPLGALVPLTFKVTDKDGEPANAGTAVLTVTKPDGTTTTPSLTNDVVGTYQHDYPTLVVGHHSARIVLTGVNAGAVEDNFEVTGTNLRYVTLAALREYLGDTSATDGELTSALAAEQSAQAARCKVDPYPADLREALLRRVARNLAARSVPVATFSSFEGGTTSARVPQTDAEIQRLEGPYHRRTVG
jgi:hypothetical protein